MNNQLPEYFSGAGNYVDVQAGIYAIANPIGEIYVGQSRNIPDRIRGHKKYGCCSAGMKLKSSILRHGRKNHRFYLIEEIDVCLGVSYFQEREKLHIKNLSDAGFALLNMTQGGEGGISVNQTNKKVIEYIRYNKTKSI